MAQQIDFEQYADKEAEDPFAQFADPTPETTTVVPPVAEPERGMLGKAYDWATTGITDAPSRAAKFFADKIDAPDLNRTPFDAQTRGLLAGITQGAGDLISGLTSPIDIAATALTGGANLALKAGRTVPKTLTGVAMVADALPVAHGSYVALDPTSNASLGERGAGAVEAALGALGAKSVWDSIPNARASSVPTNNTASPVQPEIPSAQKSVAAPTVGTTTSPQIKPLDYSISSTEKAKGILTTAGADPMALEGMSNKQLIEMAESAKPGWQKTPGKIKIKVDSSGQYDLNDPVTKAVVEAARTRKPVPSSERVSPNEAIEMPDKPVSTGNPEIDSYRVNDYLSLPRAIQTAYDLSMPFRQGLGLIHTKGWWQAWPDMIKSVGSEDAYKAVMGSINQRENFTPRVGVENVITGKVIKKPSFAEEAGLAITDLGKLSKREEEFGSKLAEKIPGIRASNRAATAFMNKLRADNFDALVNQVTAAGLDPKSDLILAKEIANFVNNASGRGSLGFESLEKSADALNNLLFSPRLMASRLQMLNPKNYVMGNPTVRRQYLKSALALGAAWNGIAELGKLAGGEVNNDAKSSDFRQIKFGNTRIDPSGGFRPFIVLARRLGEIFEKDKERYTGKFGARTPVQDITDFFENKLAPNPAFATGPIRADDKFPFYAGDELTKMFTPIMVQDIIEVLRENPNALGFTIPANMFGMGTNTYQPGKGEEPRMTEPIFPKKYDLRFPRQ